MLVACPSAALMLASMAVVILVVSTPIVGLGALTAAVFRPGRQVPALNRVAKLGRWVGWFTAIVGLIAWPVSLFGLGIVAIAHGITYFNDKTSK